MFNKNIDLIKGSSADVWMGVCMCVCVSIYVHTNSNRAAF